MVSLFTFSLLFSTAAFASPAPHHGLRSHGASGPFALRASRHDGFAPSRDHSKHIIKRAPSAKRCPTRKSSSSLTSSSTTTTTSTHPAAPTNAPGNVGAEPEPPTPNHTTTAATHTTTDSGGSGGNGGNSGIIGGGPGLLEGQPPHWPQQTQAGPTYKTFYASDADPNLLSISEVSLLFGFARTVILMNERSIGMR